MGIELLLCGGTIDKTYFPAKEIFDFDKTHIDAMISQSRMPHLQIKHKLLFLKDSLNINDNDRLVITKACIESKSEKILIMHGTSSMTDSAKLISKENIGNKVIVFFGAMLPFELSKSDALFNFGTAVSACQLLNPGVYISMNGKTWRHDEVVKNGSEATFIDKGGI